MSLNGDIEISRVELAGIPCLFCRPSSSGAIATIILYHGWSSCKEDKKFLASVLSHFKYQVIIPDSLCHGERGKLNYKDNEAAFKNFWNIIIQNVIEFGDLISDAEKAVGINKDKLAVAGSSMGGFSAAGIFANYTGIKCLVNINGSCAWEKAEEVFRKIEKRPPASEKELIKIREYDPILKKERLINRAMLLIHGESDTIVPIESQKYFYNAVSACGSSFGKVKFVEVPRLNHFISVEMLEETINWLNRYMI